MKLQRIIQKVYFDPVAITPAGHAAIRTVIENKLALNLEEDDEDTDFFGDPIPKPYDIGSTRVVPVYGTIGYKVGNIAKSCGVADVLQIKEWIKGALDDSNVTGIVLDISSPGGGVSGVPELANFIKAGSKKKKIVSFTNDLMASAAYWIASATDEIYATPTADVGSIGVYSYILDVSQAYADQGVKVEMFKDGKYKGMGTPGMPLTDEQRTFLQEDVMKISRLFKGFVKANRPNVTDEQMQGQTLMAYEVIGSLVDMTVEDIEDIISN